MTFYSYFFSACGKSGSAGPTQADLDDFYKNSLVSVTFSGNGIQKWTVPYSGYYDIEAAGAAGASMNDTILGGKGARIRSIFKLVKNDILYILVGQIGTFSDISWGAGGGGGTYVAKKVTTSEYVYNNEVNVVPLLVAAGGGGSGDGNDVGTFQQKQGDIGHCEFNGEGGGKSGETSSSGGAGFKSNSEDTKSQSFLNCGLGSAAQENGKSVHGGFGGGGSPWNGGGGGGGFRGGDSGQPGYGGLGGYSYSQNKNVSCTSGANQDSGSVLIVLLKKNGICFTSCRQNIMLFSLVFVNLNLLK